MLKIVDPRAFDGVCGNLRNVISGSLKTARRVLAGSIRPRNTILHGSLLNKNCFSFILVQILSALTNNHVL